MIMIIIIIISMITILININLLVSCFVILSDLLQFYLCVLNL